MPPGGFAGLAPLIAAAAIGWLLGVTSGDGVWTLRAGLAAVLVGAMSTLITWAWHALSSALDPIRFSGIPEILDIGFALLPALATAVLLGRPGAATVGHLTRLALAAATGLPGASTYPALAFLQVPLVMLPVELYSSAATWSRRLDRAHRTRLGGSFVGLLLGLGSATALRWVVPDMFFAVESAITLAVGAVSGWLIVAGMQRAGLFDRSFVPAIPSWGIDDDGQVLQEPRIIRRSDIR